MEPKPNPFLIASLSGSGDQTLLQVTLATAAVIGLVVFITAFLLGLSCGWGWGQRRQRRLEAAANLKRRARA